MLTMILCIAICSSPVRIAVLGDRTGRSDDEKFEQAVNTILLMNPDIVLTVGDFIEGYVDIETAEEDWEYVLEVMQDLISYFPVIWTPGNNDIWDETSEELWMEKTEFNPSYVRNEHGINFVVWDVSRTSDYDQDQESLLWLEQTLADLDSGEPVLLSMHKPFFMMLEKDSTANENFHQLMVNSGVDAVIAGHIHTYAAERRDGVLYISAGPSGGGTHLTGFDQATFNQVGWMTVTEDSISYTVIEAGKVFPENLNTAEEEILSWSYYRNMIQGKLLEPELESATMRIVPQEQVPRTISMNFLNPGNWIFTPDTLTLYLENEGMEIRLDQHQEGNPYPVPEWNVCLTYGPRDKTLDFVYSWPVQRSLQAFEADVIVDGMVSAAEYPGRPEPQFAKSDGTPAEMEELFLYTAADDSLLFLGLEARIDCGKEADAEIGLVFQLEDSFAYVTLTPDEENSWQTTTGNGNFIDWNITRDFAHSWSGNKWCAEFAVPLDVFGPSPEMIKVHVYVWSEEEGLASWAYPLRWDESTMGIIYLPVRRGTD